MKLRFEYPGIEYSVDSILEFTGEELSDFWSGLFLHFFPDVDKDAYMAMDEGRRRDYLTDYFTAFEEKNIEMLREKAVLYNEYWMKYEDQITAALEDAFEVDLTDLFNDMTCMITFNPVSPRYLESHTFDSFYLSSEKGALGSAIHEIIHFVWFYVWQRTFRDDVTEYETPHLKWIFSEMAVEPVMRDERLGSINPYYLHKACVYPYFYTMLIEGKPVLDTLYEMFCSMRIQEFMQTGYRFCTDHEEEIRKHMEESESA